MGTVVSNAADGAAASSEDHRHDALGAGIGSSSSADRHPGPCITSADASAESPRVAGEGDPLTDEAGVRVADEHQSNAASSALPDDGVSDAAGNAEPISEAGRAQQVVQDFVRNITRGMHLHLLRNSSEPASFTTELVTVSLDKRLRTLSVQRTGPTEKAQHFGLELVIEVAIGSDIRKTVELPTDDLCVTLLLKDLKALSFRFAKSEDRDVFALCISMFVDGRREEVERKKNGQGQVAIEPPTVHVHPPPAGNTGTSSSAEEAAGWL